MTFASFLLLSIHTTSQRSAHARDTFRVLIHIKSPGQPKPCSIVNHTKRMESYRSLNGGHTSLKSHPFKPVLVTLINISTWVRELGSQHGFGLRVTCSVLRELSWCPLPKACDTLIKRSKPSTKTDTRVSMIEMMLRCCC